MLEKAKHAAGKGEHSDDVEAELKSGAKVKLDSNLILKPWRAGLRGARVPFP